MATAQNSGQTYSMRVIGIYATRWRHKDHTTGEQPGFEWGRLKEFYESFQDQLPRTLVHTRIPSGYLAFTSPDAPATRIAGITKAESWLFALPSDQVVAAVALDFDSPDLNVDATLAVRLLEVPIQLV